MEILGLRRPLEVRVGETTGPTISLALKFSSDVPVGNPFEVRNKIPHFRKNEFYLEEDLVSL